MNKNLSDTSKILKAAENSETQWIEPQALTIVNKKEKRSGFLDMLLNNLDASLLKTLLSHQKLYRSRPGFYETCQEQRKISNAN